MELEEMDTPIVSLLKEGVHVALEHIMPDPNQPRQWFDQEYIRALAQSMRAGAQYEAVQLEPITDEERSPEYPHARYILVGGENRWRAAPLAGIVSLRADIGKPSKHPLDRHLKALGLNGVRQPLNRLDMARAFRRQLDRTDVEMDIEQLARIMGRTTNSIRDYLTLLNLPKEIQVLLDPPTPREKRITMIVAINIARRVEPERMLSVFDQIQSLRTQAERNQAALSLAKMGRKTRTRKPSDDADVLRGFIATMCAKLARLDRMDTARVFATLRMHKDVKNGTFLQSLETCLNGIEKIRSELLK